MIDVVEGGARLEPVEVMLDVAGVEVARVGLEGDRYARRTGHYSGVPKVDRDITLIEAEEIARQVAGPPPVGTAAKRFE